MRTKIVAGNWKMNKTFSEAEELLNDLAIGLEAMEPEHAEVVLCPPFIYLELAEDFADGSNFTIGAQNISEFESGAYTGEVSAAMLKAMDIAYAIIGHSERRKYFNESHETLRRKVDMALKHGVIPIFCCGEVLSEREAGRHFDVVRKQLEESLFHLPKEEFSVVVIAYEPVWAIGTGVNATPDQAQEMHAAIRTWIEEQYGQDIAGESVILYGGSCNAANAGELFDQPDVDGGLIGGASLKAEEFLEIVRIAEAL